MKNVIALAAVLSASVLAQAHEFWLEPAKFYFGKGEIAQLNFRVGDDFLGEPWNVSKLRITRFEHHSVNRHVDIRDSLKDSLSQPARALLSSPGAHLFVLESDPAFTRLSGESFTEYLREDGLDDVLYQRERAGISGDSASELYSRHAKVILQAGDVKDGLFAKVCDLPVEIVPLQNPALLKKGDRISFRILFEGKPLFGAKVKVWNRYQNRVSVQNIFSQQDGTIETHVSNPGAWMVSVVKMVTLKEGQADYRSYWGSLVFGVR